MTPEERFALLKRDDDRWENTDFTPPRTTAPARRHWPVWAQLSAVVASGLVVGLIVTFAVIALRQDPVLPPATPTPTATPDVVGSMPDDGRVLNAPLAGTVDASAPETVVPSSGNASLPWVVIDANPDDAAISIAYVAGSTFQECQEHMGVEVTESEESVTIAVLSVDDGNEAEDQCAENIALGAGAVELAEPLGSRTLWHAPLTAPWDTEASPLITEDPSAAPTLGDMTCESLLDEDAVAEADDFIVSGGYADVEYANKNLTEMIDAGLDNQGLSTFLQYGGVACRWGVENGDVSVPFAFGPITTEQAQGEKDKLIASGIELIPDSPYERYGEKGNGESYAFGDGYWAYRYDNGTPGDKDVLDMLVENAPDPTAFASAEDDSTDAPVVEQTKEQKKAVITTTGYGKVKVGAPVPSTTIVTWYPDACEGTGRWGLPESASSPDDIIVSTESKKGDVESLSVFSPEITTKSGAHVGMSRADLEELFPTATAKTVDNVPVLIVADTLGQVVFEMPDDTVRAIDVIGPNADVFISINGGEAGLCPAG
jgi:hypothetical protein